MYSTLAAKWGDRRAVSLTRAAGWSACTKLADALTPVRVPRASGLSVRGRARDFDVTVADRRTAFAPSEGVFRVAREG